MKPTNNSLEGFPNLVKSAKESVSSIEIDTDSLQQDERYENDAFGLDFIRKLTAKWVNENAYSKTGTIWAWSSQSFNFHHPSFSMFYAVLGMPKEFTTYLGMELKRELGECVRRDSDSVMPNEAEGWDARCHIEDGKVWEMIDPSLWQEVG
ncbi:MAG: hypothetical protein WCI06_03840 [Methylococcaceae bacterium]